MAQAPKRSPRSNPAPVRVLIVDDHPLARAGMRMLLAGARQLEIGDESAQEASGSLTTSQDESAQEASGSLTTSQDESAQEASGSLCGCDHSSAISRSAMRRANSSPSRKRWLCTSASCGGQVATRAP